ncbi:MAG: hypothetical protein U1F47_02705 [Hyphomicrobiales bacterium]
MARRKTLRDELEELRSELASVKRPSSGGKEPEEDPDGPVETQLAELNRLVKSMIEEAEDTISDHPVATVAAALALGIVIGRLSAR